MHLGAAPDCPVRPSPGGRPEAPSQRPRSCAPASTRPAHRDARARRLQPRYAGEMSSQQEIKARTCYPCECFERGFMADPDAVIARRVMHRPVTQDHVRLASRDMLDDAMRLTASQYLVVHVEKGRSMARLSVTAA